MFKRKYPALLRGVAGNLARRVEYTVEGGKRIWLVDDGSYVLILNNDGTVSGSGLYDLWEPL